MTRMRIVLTSSLNPQRWLPVVLITVTRWRAGATWSSYHPVCTLYPLCLIWTMDVCIIAYRRPCIDLGTVKKRAVNQWASACLMIEHTTHYCAVFVMNCWKKSIAIFFTLQRIRSNSTWFVLVWNVNLLWSRSTFRARFLRQIEPFSHEKICYSAKSQFLHIAVNLDRFLFLTIFFLILRTCMHFVDKSIIGLISHDSILSCILYEIV